MSQALRRNILLAIVLLAVGAAIWYLEAQKPPMTLSSNAPDVTTTDVTMTRDQKAKQYQPAKELVDPSGFLNSQPFKLSDLIGKKVILLDFWTYSCINCQRTLPYMNAWYQKYRDQGLEIVGVHTPEFDFEKNPENVKEAIKQFGIQYPVVLDNNYGTWNAYANRYWPRKYLIDIDGYVVYDHIGEGSYEETEREIQALLKERQTALGEQDQVKISTDLTHPNNAESAETTGPMTPETYFGASRNERLGNGVRATVGEQQFSPPPSMSVDTPYLLGSWSIQPEYAEAKSSGAGMVIKYRAAKVFFVASADHPVTVRVRRDGQALTDTRGRDVAPDSTVTVQEDRLYRIVEDPAGYGEHTLELEFSDPGVRVYTLTFG